MVLPENILRILLVIVSSYLIGSIPTAYIIARTRNINIFEVGSGNMGGTNVARSMGFWWGFLVMSLDICKGLIAVAVATQYLLPEQFWTATTISAIAVVIGHNWSLFATALYMIVNRDENGKLPRLTLRGGKGAATAFGTLLMIAPPYPIIAMLVSAISIVVVTRFVSLGVLTGFAIAIGWLIILVLQAMLPHEILIYSIVISVIIAYRFRGNIQRLIAGTERRLGETA